MRSLPATHLLGMIALVCGLTACVQASEKRTDLRSATDGGQMDDAGTDTADTADATDAGTDAGADDGSTDAGDWLADIEADASLTYYNFAKAVLDDHCVGCHGATPSSGAPGTFRLDVYDDGAVAGVESKLSAILARIADDSMPPVSDEDYVVADRRQLAAWIKGGGVKGLVPPEPLNPSVTFTAPATLHAATTAGSYDVTVTFDDAPISATWDLYYATTSGAVSGGTTIASDLPVTTTTQSWNLSALPDNEYFLYAVLNAGDDVIAQPAPGSVDWDNPGDNNAPPTVTLTGPWTGTTVANRAVVLPRLVTYAIADADAGDTHTVKIEYRADGGAWQTVVAGHTDATQYLWDDTASPLPEGVAYELRVTVHDGTTEDDDASTAPFGIADALYSFTVDTAPILANCIGGGCHDPGFGDWTDYDVVFPRVDTIITRAIDGTAMNQENAGSQGAPLVDADKLRFKLWRWQGALQN